jgi:hypothetical protein
MYNVTMGHHFRRPQAMFLIMDHCSIVTVGRLDHAYWRGPPCHMRALLNRLQQTPPYAERAATVRSKADLLNRSSCNLLS